MQRRTADGAAATSQQQRTNKIGNALNKSGTSSSKIKFSTVATILMASVVAIVLALAFFAASAINQSPEASAAHLENAILSQSQTAKTPTGKEQSPATNNDEAPGQGQRKDNEASSSSNNNNSNVEYHIIFSSGCKTSQDWQSFVFFYQAMIVKQPGTVTRIVSGCNEEQEATLRKTFREMIEPMAPGRFKVHFTPDYSNLVPNYKYFNKPFGTKHWLENVLGFPDNPTTEDAIVILLDPDQAIVRPFTNNDFSNTIWKEIEEGKEPRTRIEHGFPMGQLYGFAMQWRKKIDMSKITDEKSPVDAMSNEEAKHYVVGPPYVATARDMYSIVSKWCEFAIPVHAQYPHLLAEMFAYCLAAAHLKLSHQVARSFMVSDTGASGEGWRDIDELDAADVCREDIDPKALPWVLHFCQRYALGNWFFGKYRLPDTFLTCEHPLMAEPPLDVATKYSYADYPGGQHKDWTASETKRNGFMMCRMIRAVNGAATYFKRNHCGGKGNFNKTLMYDADEKR